MSHARDYVIVDIETTGLSRHHHRITEIAAARLRDNTIIDEFHTLINPHTPIPRFITRLTGIDNELVKDAPPIVSALPAFLDYLSNDILVAHNAPFDYGFLHHNAAQHLDRQLTNEMLCTRRLASRLLPQLPSKRLGRVCEHLNITNERAHRARGDVHATAQVFAKFLDMLQQRDITKQEDIIKFNWE